MSKILRAFLENEPAIRRIFMRYFRHQEDVEDLTQEIFVKCFSAEMKSEIIEPKAFLLSSAKNLALSELKRKVRTTTDSIEDSGGSKVLVDEGAISAEAMLDSKRKLAVLARAIAELPPHYRRVFWMRKIEGLKLTQIAARLDVALSTAKKHIGEALHICENSLRANGYELAEFGASRKNEGRKHETRKTVIPMPSSMDGAANRPCDE